MSISVPDLQQAKEFYGKTLGLGQPLYDLPDAGWIEFSAGSADGNISIVQAEPGWKPSFGTTVVLNVADCRAGAQKLRRCGVQCEEPVDFPGFVTYASFFDPLETACRCAALTLKPRASAVFTRL